MSWLLVLREVTGLHPKPTWIVVDEKIRGKLNGHEVEQLVRAQKFWISIATPIVQPSGLCMRRTGAPPAYLACMEAMAGANEKSWVSAYAVRLK